MTIDIRLDVEFFQHHKTIKMERRLGLPAIKALLQLWMWAAKNRPDGTLTNMDGEDIEIAAGWTGDAGAFFEALLDLRWLDEDEDKYSLHNWKSRNEWVATSTNRGDQARFLRLAQVAPDIYKEMCAQGQNAITRDEYSKVVTEYNVRRAAGEPPGSRQQSAQRDASIAPAPHPIPNPEPNPNPIPNIKEDPGQVVDNSIPSEVMEMAKKALKIYHAFPQCRCRPGDQDLLWIVSLYQNNQTDIVKCFVEALKWVQKKGLMIKEPRAFLEDWLKKLRK